MSQRRFLYILIALNLVRGILYATIIPLWQAPDEQSHFEYVALIAEQGRLPEEGAVSSGLRREIVAAMAEQNWNHFMNWKLDGDDVLPGSTPDIPGPAELRHPSLYYLSSAMVIWPLRQQEISIQLYVLRLYSMLLGTLTLSVVYAAACELFAQRWRLQVAVSLLFLFIPAHTFLSTTVSNDRLAELILSAQFFLWTRVFRRGLTWRRALSIAILLGLGLWTKATTAIGIPLAGIALIIYASPRVASVFQKPTRGYLALSLLSLASLILIGGLLVDPRNAQGWNKTGGWNSQGDTLAYEGQHAIRVQSNKGQNNASVYQEVPPSTWQPLAGKQVTLKALVRTEKAEQTGFLQVLYSNQIHRTGFIAGPEWTSQIVESVVPTDTQKLWVYLGISEAEGVLVFDSIQLVESNDLAASAKKGRQNLLINGSGEVSQWDLKPSYYHLVTDVLHLNVDPVFFTSLFDWRRSVTFREQYWTELWIMLTNFWASLGARQVNPALVWQWILALAIVTSAAGLVLWIERERRGKGDLAVWQKRILAFFIIAAVLSVVIPFFRMHPLPTRYYPHGRYVYVGIVPIVTVLVLGWREWAVVRFKIVHKTWLLAAGMVAGCLFDAVMLFGYAIPYFYGPI